MKKSLIIVVLLTIIVDAYYFDFTLRVFPAANSKMILALFGGLAFVYKSIREHKVQISSRVFISAIISIIFSLWCYFCIVVNGSTERAYVTYFMSFATWIGGAYGVYSILRFRYDRVDLMLITQFLAAVGASQCILALMIDNIPAFHDLVNRVFLMATNFLERGNRLYGIGCALDPAGIRFSAIQVLIAHQLAREDKVRANAKRSTALIISFLIITVVGSMISRTTIVGTILGLGYVVACNFRIQEGGLVSKVQIKSTFLLLFLISGVALISMVLYNSNPTFHDDLRFGFEGFFNWVETGSFRTGSTDHLQTMWVWPTTPRGWIIGEGLFGVFQTNSDIGYCNFILYCGLIGMIIYSIYYIYNHLSFIGKFRHFTFTAFLLIATTFIVWAKVTTDIFLADALLFCIDGDNMKD